MEGLIVVTPDLLISTIYICLTLALCEIVRRLIKRFFSDAGLFEASCLESIACFEICVVCYELGIVSDESGMFMYGVYLFLATLWWGMAWGDSSGCAYTHVQDWVQGNLSTFSLFAFTTGELIGGLMFYSYYLKHLWALQYGPTHRERLNETQCTSDIQISPWIGGLIEGGGVLVCESLARVMSEMDLAHQGTINAFVSTSLVLAATSTTGGYFHPALATALQYGCSGSSPLEHFSVYWIAETIGALIALKITQQGTTRSLWTTKTTKIQ